MTLQVLTPKDEDQWLEWRKTNINSTETAALFGFSPYMTPYELYHVKMGNMDDGFVENKRTKAGKYLEESIAKYALDELKCEGKPMKDYWFDDELNMGSSFDWLITSGPMKDWILEIKNVDYLVYKDKWDDFEAPEHIEAQVQHQLELTGKPGAVICVLVGGNDLKFIYRERDFEFGRGIREKIAAFWDGVASGMEPAPDFIADSEAIIAVHQSAGFETFDATEDVIITALMSEYMALVSLEKEAETAKMAKKAEILDTIGDEYLKVLGGDGMTLSCGMTKSSEGQLITQDMVGQTKGGRKSFRQFRINKKKPAKNKNLQ